MRKKAFSLLLLLLGLFCGLTASAQSSDQKAQVIPVLFPNSSAFTALSDNGLWAVSCGPGDDQSQMFYPYLINAQTGEYTQLWTADDELNSLGISVVDVTNDGNIIVGNRSYIAYRNFSTVCMLIIACAISADGGSVGCARHSQDIFCHIVSRYGKTAAGSHINT